MTLKKLLTAIAVTASLCLSVTASALTSNYTTYATGQTLTAASLNSLQTNYTDGDNNILNGDTLTGNMLWNGGVDILMYSDTATNLTASIDGATGKFIGAVATPGVYNLNIKSATTTNANDSVTVECGNEACSATNPGFVVMNSGTVGDLVVFRITADVTQLLTGAHWGIGTTGDITGALIRALFVNDNGTLRTCWAYLGGRKTVLTTDTNATHASVNLPEEVLCNTAVASATNTVLEYGFMRSNFDDTGGAAEDLWANQTGVGDFVTGKTADGLWQPWNPVFTGFSADPTGQTTRWTQVSRIITAKFIKGSNGTSDATGFTVSLPAKAFGGDDGSLATELVDNGANLTTPGWCLTSAGSTTLTLYASTSGAGTAWTGANTKGAGFSIKYEVGPAASFIE